MVETNSGGEAAMGIRRRRVTIILGIVFIAFVVAFTLRHVLAVHDPSPHRSGGVIAHDVPIDYLDWGGHGTALVFIPGFGNTAHVFDDFAPRFVPQFRVVGITRVGFGKSEPPTSGYDLVSRIGQIRAVLDSLGITRAVLIGHSLGGDELTAFAGTYPAQTLGLVYLDAAYDHVKAFELEKFLEQYAYTAPKRTSADLAGANAYQGLLERERGVRFPIGEVLATRRFDWTGAVVGNRTPARVFDAIVAAVQPPDYIRVRAPALALYSDWETAADIFPWLRANPTRNARITAELRKKILPQQAAARARFSREVKGAQVVAFPAHHYDFLSHPDEVERRIRAFLAALPQ
ncbi:MAG TPA: alpha/beta hydrolase [Thermoanaerobaculia bacterium]|nr:alpha/beta hydrolase [Thermoanaerobaculia bacterium]